MALFPQHTCLMAPWNSINVARAARHRSAATSASTSDARMIDSMTFSACSRAAIRDSATESTTGSTSVCSAISSARKAVRFPSDFLTLSSRQYWFQPHESPLQSPAARDVGFPQLVQGLEAFIAGRSRCLEQRSNPGMNPLPHRVPFRLT